MKIIAQFEKGTFWNNADGYRIVESNDSKYSKGTRFDWAKAMYEAQRDGYTLELVLIH